MTRNEFIFSHLFQNITVLQLAIYFKILQCYKLDTQKRQKCAIAAAKRLWGPAARMSRNEFIISHLFQNITVLQT